MNRRSFSSLSKNHAELHWLFDNHQRALLAKDVDLAIAKLTTFGNVLNRHIDFQEQRLLPLYVNQGAETPGGTLLIFQAEHRKLRDELMKLRQLTDELPMAHDLSGSILALLDEETAFKSLFRHHAAREQNLLFPRLDERTTEEEREVWLSRHTEPPRLQRRSNAQVDEGYRT
jgi:hemerythrin-like domain-containing protein